MLTKDSDDAMFVFCSAIHSSGDDVELSPSDAKEMTCSAPCVRFRAPSVRFRVLYVRSSAVRRRIYNINIKLNKKQEEGD